MLVLGAAQWTPLFDGKTLTGWTRINGTAQFSVDKGEIVGKTVKGSPNSFLCSDKPYADFEMEVDLKTDPRMNSGIQFRSVSVPGYMDGRVHGYQAEADPTGRGWSGGLYEEGRRGWLQDLSKNEKAQKAFKNGAWNHYRIVAKGDHIQIWVNKVQTTDFRDPLTARGFIAMQVHQSDIDGLEVRWKNAKIKDLGDPTMAPPKTGKWLLKTQADTKNWVREADDAPFPWLWTGTSMQTRGGDLRTKESFGDARYHFEFMTDDNGKEGQANGNSGIYFQQSYEIQILNSAPRGPLHNECGGFYQIKAPDYAMAYPAGKWQTYDIEFHAAKWQDGKKVQDAWVTAYHNGTRIHDKIKLPKETASGKGEAPGNRPIRLQDHGNNVQYRNIWVAPL